MRSQNSMSNQSSCKQPLRALVVDDDLDSVILLTTILEIYEVKVISAHCAAQAIQKMRSLPDILISDLAMPLVDGYELIRYIRQLPPDRGGTIPAIALSGWISSDTETLALSAGFQAFLEKPYDSTNLLKLVSKLTGWDFATAELAA